MAEVADDLAEMLAAQRAPSRCAVCRLKETMTPEHAETFQASYGWDGVNTTGQLAWLSKRGYVLDVKAPTKALLSHKHNCGR